MQISHNAAKHIRSNYNPKDFRRSLLAIYRRETAGNRKEVFGIKTQEDVHAPPAGPVPCPRWSYQLPHKPPLPACLMRASFHTLAQDWVRRAVQKVRVRLHQSHHFFGWLHLQATAGKALGRLQSLGLRR